MAGADPTAHRPDQSLFAGGTCEFCGDLSTDPTRCPGYLLHRTRQVYRVEGWENGGWNRLSSTQMKMPGAEEHLAALKRRFPDMPMRIVAETTAYMVIRTAPAINNFPAVTAVQGQTPPDEGDRLT